MHKHLCLNCNATIAEGEFDCETDADHDSEICGACASVSEAAYEEDEEQETFAREQIVANVSFLSRI